MKRNSIISLCLVLVILILILVIAKSCNSNESSINRLTLTPESTTRVIPDKVIILEKIQQVSKLETTVFSFEQVIKGVKDNGALWGSFADEIIFVAFGQVVAGVDLSKINKTDVIVVDETTLKIKLPQVEIFSVILDNQRSYIANRKTGFLTYPDDKLETQIRQEAVRQLEVNAINSGIINVAGQNAQDDLKNLLQCFGFNNIEFDNTSTKPLNLIPTE